MDCNSQNEIKPYKLVTNIYIDNPSLFCDLMHFQTDISSPNALLQPKFSLFDIPIIWNIKKSVTLATVQ
ncbi:hypothetical protein B6A42_18500 [Vibrio coralliilyticus]|nr:hypothetical protein B6A42_18500 [Vibrio coralliilyticus]PAW00966.1 hypothetical protein CKJ79_24265 [Vibrio coralliilyticus]